VAVSRLRKCLVLSGVCIRVVAPYPRAICAALCRVQRIIRNRAQIPGS
jgi:hypothetical protein